MSSELITKTAAWIEAARISWHTKDSNLTDIASIHMKKLIPDTVSFSRNDMYKLISLAKPLADKLHASACSAFMHATYCWGQANAFRTTGCDFSTAFDNALANVDERYKNIVNSTKQLYLDNMPIEHIKFCYTLTNALATSNN